MSKAILMSIQPKWVCEILNGKKKKELRKKFPKDYVGWVYIYCTNGEPYLWKGVARPMHDTNINNPFNWIWILENRNSYMCGGYNGKVVARFWCNEVDELETCFCDEDLYAEDTCYQWIRKVDLEQLVDCEGDKDMCDRYELYSNEMYEYNECYEKDNQFLQETCLTGRELQSYFKNKNIWGTGYAIDIKKLEIFDKPKELYRFMSFHKPNYIIEKAPQSWCYIEGE